MLLAQFSPDLQLRCELPEAQESFKSPHNSAATLLSEGTAKAIRENAELILETSDQEPVGMS